jgi:DNA replication and repair protein RecF
LFEIDGKSYQRLSFERRIPVVLFEPEHLRLLSGGPERRREYIDDLIEQTVSGFGALRRQYKRTLAQRNTLLKKGGGDLKKQIFPWNVRLSELAGQIVRARAQIINKIDEQINELYKTLSSTKTTTKISYQNRWPVDSYESRLLKELESGLELDQLRGFTGHGPHREDTLLLFNNHPIQEIASRGESRTAVLALKIIELNIVEDARSSSAVLFLDDVFSELDGARRHALTNSLGKHQAFITTTDADMILKNFTSDCRIIPLT